MKKILAYSICLMYNTKCGKNDTLGNVLSDQKSMISCIYVRDIYKKQVKTALVLLRRFLLL